MYYSGQTSIIIACRALTSPHPSAPEFTRRLEYVNICIGALLEYSQVYKMGAASASALARLRDRMLEERLSVPKSAAADSISAPVMNAAAELDNTIMPQEPLNAAVPTDDLVTVASWLAGTSGTIPNLSASGAGTSAALPLLPSLADLAAGGTAPEPPLETGGGAQDPLDWILQDQAMSPEVAGGTYDWQIQAAGRLANTAFAP
ncbi:hypothetical protein Rhopal_007089-T1 [Rhodotorula paludigena]|uniref:Uncharacterized protein n=1 Tax=Rhodotorula paludigena TaxID=86838 RepID=A0AAV5GNV7_9BASI|nr:hypothetical protein Rhopal_007089-T1 [Rhodotorula paludigena]